MDFLTSQGLPNGVSVLEAGCGWGPAGIFCAKKFDAKVTGLDADAAVFPYLNLHAEINGVDITTYEATFDKLKKKQLRDFQLVIGGDICFWDEMKKPVYKLVEKAIDSGVGQVIIADPGRPPFHKMAEKVIKRVGGEVKEWSIDDEVKASAYLLIVGSLP
jgi:predicted nicotinamide N-methyase